MIHRYTNLLIALNQSPPLSVVRLGNVEATQLLIKNDEIYEQMPTNAGFFGTKEELKEWKKYYHMMFYVFLGLSLYIFIKNTPKNLINITINKLIAIV